jgi:two-component system NtrC family sensor kinase
MTIRLKLAIGSIAVILLANAVLSLVTVDYLEGVWLSEVQTRVRLDLNSAREAFKSHGNSIARFLEGAALDQSLATALQSGDRSQLARLITRVYRGGKMDFVSLVDPAGKVLFRARNPGNFGDNLSEGPLLAEAIRTRRLVTGTVVVPAELLEREGEDLARRALIKIQPAPAATPANDLSQSAGMVLGAAVPILATDGKLLGILYGGNLLNRRDQLVDFIRDEVFPHELYKGQQVGSMTIFLGDVRIATNVVEPDGSRAVGSRLSANVADAVLKRGTTWSDRALVVNDWHIASYEPIKDPHGKCIGALYVGLLEAPFVHHRRVISGVVLVMVSVASLASLLLVVLMTMYVLRPIGRIVRMALSIVRGDLTARVGIRPPGEMGVLCRAIDTMADAVAQREEELKSMTRRQIDRTEKLASIGRLAAGVAHEINNPLTGVLTFAHLMREKPNMDDEDRQDLGLIIHETTRAAEIVRGLLDFARERPALKQPVDINDAVRRTVRLIRNQKSFDQIVINEVLTEDLPPVLGDLNQLQQVLLNLSLNACEAMPTGGKLTITSTICEGKIVVRLTDTGAGISKDLFDKIFEPFFTTKPVGKGTGLGLSVSYGLIQTHGGTLEVESEEGKGSVFTITLPTAEDAMAQAQIQPVAVALNDGNRLTSDSNRLASGGR